MWLICGLKRAMFGYLCIKLSLSVILVAALIPFKCCQTIMLSFITVDAEFLRRRARLTAASSLTNMQLAYLAARAAKVLIAMLMMASYRIRRPSMAASTRRSASN